MSKLAEACRRLSGLINGSVSWWESNRPVGWSEAQHLENPTINCSTPAEDQLAERVAAWIKS